MRRRGPYVLLVVGVRDFVPNPHPATFKLLRPPLRVGGTHLAFVSLVSLCLGGSICFYPLPFSLHPLPFCLPLNQHSLCSLAAARCWKPA